MTARRGTAGDGTTWRWIVGRLFPTWFVERHGASLVETLLVDARDARDRGAFARAATLARNAGNLIATAWQVRRHGLPAARLSAGTTMAPAPDPRGPAAGRRFADRLLAGRLLVDLGRDVRFGLRGLRRAPGFLAAGLLTVGLGASVSAGMFSVLDRALLQPLPVHDADRLITIHSTMPTIGQRYRLSPVEHDTLADRSRTVEALTWFLPSSLDVDVVLPAPDGGVERVNGLRVARNFFDVLGVRPMAGPGFEASPDAGRELMISHHAWIARYGGAADVVGQTLHVDAGPHQIVGVLPASFDLPVDGRRPDFWIARPLSDQERAYDDGWLLDTLARLVPDATPAAAAAEIAAISEAIDDARASSTGRRFVVESLEANVETGWRQPLVLLALAAGVVLVMASGSLALLMTARHSLRRQEFALWMALGAGRAALARRLLVEALLIGLGGVLLGVAFASWGAGALLALAPLDIPRFDGVVIDPRLLAFASAAVIATAVLAGLAPAAQVRSLDVADGLRTAGRGATARAGRRARSAVVALQCATMTALLVTLGLSLTSFARLSSVEPGFQTAARYHFEVTAPQAPPATAMPERLDREVAYFDALVERLRAVSGVVGAGVVSNLPLTDGWGGQLYREHRPAADPNEAPLIDWEIAGPGYFEAAGIDVLQGRAFRESDRRGQPRVTIINETLARMAFPGEEPLGQSISGESPEGPWRRVVGVVRDVRQQALDAPPRPHMYLPLGQSFPFGTFQVVVSTRAGSPAPDVDIADAVAAAGPGAAASPLRPLGDVVAASVAGPRFALALTAIFASLAVVLSVAATWGVISFTARSRRQELAVRSALGAQRRQVVATAARAGVVPVVAGLALGALATVPIGRLLAGQFYGLRPWEPAVTLASMILLLVLSLGVVTLSASRAARVDPSAVFRE